MGTSVAYTGMQQQQAVNGSNAMATAVSNSYLQHRKGDSSISASPRQKTPISMSQYIHDPSKGQVGTILPQQQQFQAQIYYNTDNSTGIVADPSQLRQGSTDQNMLQRQQSQLNVSNHNSPSTSTQIVSPVVQTPTQYAQSSPVPQQLQRSPQTANGMRTNSGMVNANMISAQQMAMMNRNMTSQQQAVTAAYYKSQQQNGAAAFQQQQLLQQQQFAQQAAMGMATPQMVSQNAALQSQLLMQQQQQSQQQQQQQQQQQEMIQRNQLQQQTQYQQQIPQADFNKARLQQQQLLQQQQMAQQQVAQQPLPTPSTNSVSNSAEKYLRSLYEFMQNRGTPIQSMPIASGRQVHLITLHTAVARFGGLMKVNQAPNGWQMVSLFLGYNPQVEVSSPQELAKIYMDTLYPFDEHLRTLQASQQPQQQTHHQQQLPQQQQQHQFQLQQQSQQQEAVTPTTVAVSRQASPQVGVTQAATTVQYRTMAAPEQVQVMQFQKQATAAAAAAVNAVRAQRSPSSTASPQHFQSPSPVLNNRKLSRSRHATPDSTTRSPSVNSRRRSSTPLNNNNIAVNNVMNRATPVARSDSNPDLMPPPSGTPKIRKSQPPQSATPTLPQQQPAATSGPTLPSKPLLRLPKDESGKYIPKRRKLEYGYKGGSNIYELNRFGADIDSLVPDFPLFQELGSIEISTLIMALKSLIPGEVRQALDKLALLSSNPSVPIVLADCPELITALGELGLDLLNSLKANRVSNTVDVMTGDAPGDELKDDEEDGKDLVTKIFEAYRSWDESNEEIVVQVDDITGETMGEDLEIQTASDALEKVISEKSLDENGIPISSSKSTSSSLEDEYSAKTTIGFHHYDTLFELSKDEVENLNPQAGINKGKLSSFWQEALVDRFLCVCLIIRNLSFNEHNQSVIVNDEATLNFLLSVTRALALDGDKLFKSFSAVRRWFSLQKDLITLYGNLGLYIKIPSLVDALVILLLILSFSPEESPYHKAANGIEFELDFLEYEPTKHRYLGCAIDAIAKMITRDEPNKQFFKAIFNYKPSCDGGASNSNGAGGNNDGSDSVVIDKKFQVLYSKLVLLHPYELLTRTFALTIAALPRIDYKVIPKALELRRALLQQSLLVTELIIVDILDDPGLAADWTSASNGVITNTLLRTAFVLGAIYNPVAAAAAAAAAAHPHHHYQQQQVETHPFERITVRCINILTLLGEKAMLLPPATEKQKPPQAKSVTLASQQYSKRPLAPRANVGLPDVENVLSALLISTMNQTVVKKLCWFLEAGYNYVFSTSTPSAPPVLVKKKKTINGTTVNND